MTSLAVADGPSPLINSFGPHLPSPYYQLKHLAIWVRSLKVRFLIDCLGHKPLGQAPSSRELIVREWGGGVGVALYFLSLCLQPSLLSPPVFTEKTYLFFPSFYLPLQTLTKIPALLALGFWAFSL